VRVLTLKLDQQRRLRKRPAPREEFIPQPGVKTDTVPTVGKVEPHRARPTTAWMGKGRENKRGKVGKGYEDRSKPGKNQ